MLHRVLSRRRTPTARFDLARHRFTAASQPDLTPEDRRREIRSVLTASPAARRVLDQILARCRVCAPSHVPGDTHETARREGMRAVGLWLLQQVEEPDAPPPHSAADEPEAPGEDV